MPPSPCSTSIHTARTRVSARRGVFNGGEIVVRDPNEAARQRIKTFARLVAAGRSQRRQRAAVPGAFHHEGLRLGLAVLVAEAAAPA